MEKNVFSNTLSRFRRVILLFLAVVAFFFFYNAFLIDNTIEILRFSIEETAAAYDISDLDGLDLLLSQVMIEEVLPEQMMLANVANLEYARNAIASGKSYRVVDYMKTSLDAVVKEKESKRGRTLQALDWINRSLRKIVTYILKISRALPAREEAVIKIPGAEMEIIDKAESLERKGALDEALAGYEEFIKKYPSHEKIGLIKLRTATIYQRLRQYEKASSIYRGVMRKYLGRKEAFVAQALLARLQQTKQLSRKANMLLAELSELGAADVKAQQAILYQLGAINLRILNGEEAKKFFKRAVSADPRNDLAMKARFNSAWISKEGNKMEESAAEFSGIVKDNPKGAIARDSQYQIADIYHKEGSYEKAIEICLRLAEEYKDDPIAPLCLFQAGASYMCDLNNDEMAKQIFAELTRRYPSTVYAKYLAPDNPIGMFVTYLVPRATRVVAWRAGGLLCLSGYSGKLATFKVRLDEKAFNQTLNDWLDRELPDTIGNLYINIRGAEIIFNKGKAAARGKLTMGRFSIPGEAEGRLELTKEKSVNLVLTKAVLGKVPIPPALINNTTRGISLMVRKYFPITVSRISIDKGEVLCEGYGSRRMLARLEGTTKKIVGMKIDIEDIDDPKIQKVLYGSIKERFPVSDFSPSPKYDDESLFMDFFTRLYLYMGFKLLETAKDTKLDYERSIRTMGRLFIKTRKFRVSYKQEEINTSLNKLILEQFPWVVNRELFFDVSALEVYFTDNGDIKFYSDLRIGHIGIPPAAGEVSQMEIAGTASLDIDSQSGIPVFVFKEIRLNDMPLSIKKLNKITLMGLNLLKDGRIPFRLTEVKVTDGNIALKGEGADDFMTRVFTDPHLFVVFQVRDWDLGAAGIKRLRRSDVKGDGPWTADLFMAEEPIVLDNQPPPDSV